jgi:hypothetical protein
LKTQGNLLDTMRAEIETFKGEKSTTGVGVKSFKMVCFHCGMTGIHKGWKKCCQWKDLSKDDAREKDMTFATGALQAEKYKTRLFF